MLRSGFRTMSLLPARRGVASASAATTSDKPKNRPISPHVQIFKFPLPAMVSIATRFTGIGLTAGVAATGVACLVGNPVRFSFSLSVRRVRARLTSPIAGSSARVDRQLQVGGTRVGTAG